MPLLHGSEAVINYKQVGQGPDVVWVSGAGGTSWTRVEALRASGAEVWAWDDSDARRKEAQSHGFTPVDLARCDWTQVKRSHSKVGIAERMALISLLRSV